MSDRRDLPSWRRPKPVRVVLFALLCLGVWLRLSAFGSPPTFQFDEHHFVENARNYLQHRADWNDHPPLGKLILAAAIRLWGDNSVAWRLPSLLFGGLTIAGGAWAAARLFRSRAAGTFAAAFLSADGFLIAYSRAALLDGFLATSAAATLLLCSFGLTWVTALLAGLLLGFAVSIKVSGIAVIPPLLLAWSLEQRWTARRGLLAALALLLGAFTWMTLYRVGLAMADQPHRAMDVLRDTQRLLVHHAQLTEMKNPSTSGWITWAVPLRPLRLATTEREGLIRVLSMLGNLALWWSAIAVAAIAALTVLRKGTAAVARDDDGTAAPHADRSWIPLFVRWRGRAVLLTLTTALAFLAPWVVTHRDSYLYHFLPSYAALLVLLSGFVAWVDRHSAVSALVFTVVVLLVAAFYAPLWGYLPLSRRALELRLFLPGWR